MSAAPATSSPASTASTSSSNGTRPGRSSPRHPIGESPCKIAVDPTNDDVFVAGYGSQNIHKFTAESGYATKITFAPTTGTSNPGFIVNGAQNRLYVANGSNIRAIDTDSGAVVETVELPGGASEVTVDEATDTLFVASGGVIKEVAGAIVPDVTTGNSEGNDKVFGTVETAGGGPITECYFEYGVDTSYSSGKATCSPATPVRRADPGGHRQTHRPARRADLPLPPGRP